MPKAIPKKKKPKTLPQLEKILDAVFSKYIRAKYSENGICECYTCGKRGYIEDMQCGHFHSRKHNATRFDEENCRVQCMPCNVWKHGNYIEYAERLRDEIGEEAYFDLKKRSSEPTKRSREWYNQQIEIYKEKLKIMEETNASQ